jgi:protein-S-isoprenylcysteine O-methyltransferase Ste14
MKWFRVASDAPTSRHVAATLAQTAVFWATFLWLLPELVIAFERQLGLPPLQPMMAHPTTVGIPLFVWASVAGLGSGLCMAIRGRGTPLPLAAARELVCTGPYRQLRNPMAMTGIAQGIAVGIWRESAGVVSYALAGALLWHVTARRQEEAFLLDRFGAQFVAYRERVPLWMPRLLPRRGEAWFGAALAAGGIYAYCKLVNHDAASLWSALPMLAITLLIGTLLWARNRAPAVTTSPRTP